MADDPLVELSEAPFDQTPRFGAGIGMIRHQPAVGNGIAAGLIQVFHDGSGPADGRAFVFHHHRHGACRVQHQKRLWAFPRVYVVLLEGGAVFTQDEPDEP